MVSSIEGGKSRRSVLRGERGQMGPIGLSFVFGFVLVGAVLVVAFGVSSLGGTQETLNEDRAEKTLTQFDSKAALVALGNTDTQTVQLPSGNGDYQVREGEGWIQVTIDNRSDRRGEKTLFNQTMGAVVYETNDGELAYQGGGVWRSQSNNSRMVSPPEFHFRNGTLTLPAVNVTGDRSLGGTATVTHDGTVTKFPNATADSNFTNPLTNHEVKVVVQSEYYKGWGSYFQERTDGDVEYNHERKIVNLTLVSPLAVTKVTTASSSLATDGDFILQGSANSVCGATSKTYTDSYNSSATADDYCSQASNGNTGTKGDIVYGGTVDISNGAGDSDIYGNVEAGADVDVGDNNGGGSPAVNGWINYTRDCLNTVSRCQDETTRGVSQIDGIDGISSVDFYVGGTSAEVRANNDNATPQITGNTLDYSSTDSRTLGPGDYYLERIHLNEGEELLLEPDGGVTRVVVEENVELAGSGSGGAEIRVVGDGTAQVFVNGTGLSSSEDHLYMGKNSGIVNAGDDAPQFRMYGKGDFNASLDGSGSNPARFVGVIYAPPGDYGRGTINITGGEIYGGILTGTTVLDEGSIHFDEALEVNRVISQSAKVVRVTYLHVSVNRIRVSG